MSTKLGFPISGTTIKDAQTAAGDFFNDLVEGSEESYQAWVAFASKIGAPAKPYFMLTMWPYFVEGAPSPDFAVPAVPPHSSSFYMPTSSGTRVTGNITDWVVLASGELDPAPAGFSIGAIGQGSQSGTTWLAGDSPISWGRIFQSQFPPVETPANTKVIAVVTGQFPSAAFTNTFNWIYN